MATTNPARRPVEPLEPTGSAPYLPPIEKPKGLMLKLLYWLMSRQFGKVPSWLSVSGARMPLAYLTWAGKVNKLNKKLTLPQDTMALIRGRVDSLNMCGWCMDAGMWHAVNHAPHLLPKLNALHGYRTNTLFDDGERAALDYATELTKTKHVSPDTFAQLRHHYSEREICEIAWIVATNHLFNIGNHGLNIGSDGLCEISNCGKPTASTV